MNSRLYTWVDPELIWTCSDIFVKTRQGRGNHGHPSRGYPLISPTIEGDLAFKDPYSPIIGNVGKDISRSKRIHSQSTKLRLSRMYGFKEPLPRLSGKLSFSWDILDFRPMGLYKYLTHIMKENNSDTHEISQRIQSFSPHVSLLSP